MGVGGVRGSGLTHREPWKLRDVEEEGPHRVQGGLRSALPARRLGSHLVYPRLALPCLLQRSCSFVDCVAHAGDQWLQRVLALS